MGVIRRSPVQSQPSSISTRVPMPSEHAGQSVARFDSFDMAGGDGADELHEEVEPVERSIFINLIREPQVERLIGLDQQFKRTTSGDMRGDGHPPVALRGGDIDLGAVAHPVRPRLEVDKRLFEAIAEHVVGKHLLFSQESGGIR